MNVANQMPWMTQAEPPAPATALLPDELKPVSRQVLQLRPMGNANSRTATVLLSSARCLAQVHSDFLQPQITLSYERHAVDSNSGTFIASVSLLNRALHTAHQPFLCLPILGLHLSPAKGWVMQDVNSIRRLRRFGQEHEGSVEPEASVHCCNISLLFNAADGGRIEFEASNWHGLDGLPDLRLTCVAGAGNYPSERLPLVVPADTIKSLIADLIVIGDIPGELSKETDSISAYGNEF